MASPFDDAPVRIVWASAAGIALLPSETAVTCLERGYARNLYPEEVEAWNVAVADDNLSDAERQAKIEEVVIEKPIDPSTLSGGMQPAVAVPLATPDARESLAAQLTPVPPVPPIFQQPPMQTVDPVQAALDSARASANVSAPVAKPDIPAQTSVTPATTGGDVPKTGKK